jgi:glycosyltransferase involved in cell wall biosynthesis
LKEQANVTTLSIVIPAYNEENGIAEIVERVLSVRPAVAKAGVEGFELIVVDDGSRDRTAEIAQGYAEVRVIRQPNRGYGGALKTGFREARGELLAFLDADGTYPPEAYPDLCRAALEHDADLVVGSRMSGARSEMPLTRRVGNTLFATLLSLLSSTRVSDSASGMRVFKKDAVNHLYPLPDGLNFTPAMSTRAIFENLKIVEVPIEYSERVGRSKLSVLRDGFRFLHSIVWTVFTYNPVRVFGLAGFALIALGLIVALTGAGSAGPEFPRLFGALVLAVAGVNLFSIGTLFNYVVSLFHRREIRQGLFGRPVLRRPLERHFGWMGALAIAMGVAIYVVASINNWTAASSPAPWFAPAASSLLALTGMQLMAAWFLSRVMADLTARDVRAQLDLNGDAKPADSPAARAPGLGWVSATVNTTGE